MKLPNELNFLTTLMAPSFFATLPKKELFLLSTQLVKNYLGKAPTHGISSFVNPVNDFETIKHDQKTGEYLLQFYFKQISTSPNIFILDFRKDYFQLVGESLLWKKNSLVFSLSDSFAQGLKNIYIGYYFSNEEVFNLALTQLKLYKTDTQKEQIKSLFKKYFEQSNTQEMSFNIQEFISSFEDIFQYLIKEKIKIHSEFLFLGIMLGTLYWSLQRIGGTYDVKGIFFKSCQSDE